MEARPLKSPSYSRRRPETTLLYQTISENLETFIAEREADGRGLPLHVIKEFRAYLKCGLLHHGFMRIKCTACDYEGAVAFSCKKRGFCPACGGKRMVEAAEHLTQNVLPHAPYRQYVLSLTIPLRYWMATNRKLTSKVHTIWKETLLTHFEDNAKAQGVSSPLPGGITFIQRAGSALGLNIHFHTLCIEGVYTPPVNHHGRPRLRRLPPPTAGEVTHLVETLATSVIKLLRRLGYLKEIPTEVETPPLDAAFDEHPSYRDAVAASIKGRIAFGPNAGQKVRRIGSGFGYEGESPLIKGDKCATIHGFSLHAATHVGEAQRDRLAKLVRYMARPPVAGSRLKRSKTSPGDLEYTLKQPWSDGTQAILLSPMELMEKLAALVPPGRMHLTRHFGLFASHSQWRAQIVLKPEKRKGFAPDGGYEKDKVKNTRWAKMLARTFGVDVSTCPQCGEELRIVSMVYDQMQIARYLRHIGLDAHPPPIAPARYHQLSIDDIYNDSPHPEEEVQAHPEY
jgi:hypothetical protein